MTNMTLIWNTSLQRLGKFIMLRNLSVSPQDWNCFVFNLFWMSLLSGKIVLFQIKCGLNAWYSQQVKLFWEHFSDFCRFCHRRRKFTENLLTRTCILWRKLESFHVPHNRQKKIKHNMELCSKIENPLNLLTQPSSSEKEHFLRKYHETNKQKHFHWFFYRFLYFQSIEYWFETSWTFFFIA